MKYQCPCCKSEMEWKSDNPNRPFCSEQCKNKDFIDWANEEHRMAGTPEYDEILSGEIEMALMQREQQLH